MLEWCTRGLCAQGFPTPKYMYAVHIPTVITVITGIPRFPAAMVMFGKPGVSSVVRTLRCRSGLLAFGLIWWGSSRKAGTIEFVSWAGRSVCRVELRNAKLVGARQKYMASYSRLIQKYM